MSEPVRLALVTDIHHGTSKMTKKGEMALTLLHEFVEHANTTRPDIVVDLGDRISDIDLETDRRLEAEVAEVFAGLDVPRLHMLGNHDMDHLDAAANAELLSTGTAHAIVELDTVRLIQWQADVSIDQQTGMTATDADLDWLRSALGSDDRTTVVLTHVPLDNALMTVPSSPSLAHSC